MDFLHLIFQLILTLLQLFLLIWQPISWPFLKMAEMVDWLAVPSVLASEINHSLPLLFSDNFEQGLAKWDLVRGNWEYWQVTEDGWLEATLPNPYTISELVPKDEFWNLDWRNFRFEFEFEVLTSADRNWAWGLQDSNNWYEIHFYLNRFHLLRLKDRRTVFYDSGWFSLKSHHVYQVAIEFNQGLVKVWVDDELIAERQDHTYENNGGKIALKATTGGAFPTTVRFNNVRVYSLDLSEDISLHLTHFKQYDQPWCDLEYDHALSWSSWGDWQNRLPSHNQSPLQNQPPERTTINHWGCALSSLAMILDYYNLDKLPDGTMLNPGTLNTWLNKQADGYLGEGAINWLAGSRLSRLIREKHSLPGQTLPTLEFNRSYTPSTQEVVNLIDLQRPAILQIPGHFLVAHGYTQSQDDLIISDPAYTYQKFSQHDQQMVSLIDYQPSFTDLSYIMLVYDPQLTIELLDHNSESLDQVFYAQDTVADQFYDHEACLIKYVDEVEKNCFANISAPIVQYLAKPENGEFKIKITTNENSNQQLIPWQIFAYDEWGEVKMVDRLSFLSEENITLNFDKTELANVSFQTLLNYNFLNFSVLLNEKFQQKMISLYPYLSLREVTDWAMLAQDTKAQDRYAQLILQLMQELSGEITESAKQELLQSLVEG